MLHKALSFIIRLSSSLSRLIYGMDGEQKSDAVCDYSMIIIQQQSMLTLPKVLPMLATRWRCSFSRCSRYSMNSEFCIAWSSRLPDTNPFRHIWSLMSRLICRINSQQLCKQWVKLGPVSSMPRRMNVDERKPNSLLGNFYYYFSLQILFFNNKRKKYLCVFSCLKL